MSKPRLLIIGATGALGRHVLDNLVVRGASPESVTAAGRNVARLAELDGQGFATAHVELSDPKAVTRLVAGHSHVVLISGSDPDRVAQHRTVISAAKKAGAEHIYYTSGLRANEDAGGVNADHKATEDALTRSGVTHTILRNTWYIENYLRSLDGPRYTGVLAAAVGEAKIAPASRKDLAEALAVVITTDGHDDTTYSLSGDTDFTYHDIAHAMGSVLGRPVTYAPVSPDELHARLTGAGLDSQMSGFLVDLDRTISSGTFARAGDDLTRLIGRATTGLIGGLTGGASHQ